MELLLIGGWAVSTRTVSDADWSAIALSICSTADR